MSRMTWPCAIFEDRYGGTYSGGKWIAIHPAVFARLRAVEDVFGGDDFTASQFEGRLEEWAEDGTIVAVGDTPDAALKALEAKLSAPEPQP